MYTSKYENHDWAQGQLLRPVNEGLTNRLNGKDGFPEKEED